MTGLEHLIHYNESLPIVSSALHLTWQYLIKFRDKTTFEKQEISISFLTNMEEPIQIDGEEEYYHDNVANIRIQHTARTWGADIEGLLTKHLNTIIHKESKIKRFIRYNPENIQNLVAATLTLITLTFSLYNNYKYRQMEIFNTATQFWVHHYGGLLFVFAITYLIIKGTFVFLEEFQVFDKPSFLLLTTESQKQKIKTLTNYKQNLRRYFVAIIGSLLLGVISNYIYTYLTQK